MNNLKNCPRLSLPFTILYQSNQVRLVAGEDFRYTLTGKGLDTWLPDVLNLLNGTNSVENILAKVATKHKEELLALFDRLYGERLLVDGTEINDFPRHSYKIKCLGQGAIRKNLENRVDQSSSLTEEVLVLCQDTLDYQELLEFNNQALKSKQPWLWASTGAMSRGFVSPICFPNTSPCLACLVTHFSRLSPMPEIYQELIRHKEEKRPLVPASFPQDGIDLLVALVSWKISFLSYSDFPSSIFRLHVLETDSLEVTAHRIFTDPECNFCYQK